MTNLRSLTTALALAVVSAPACDAQDDARRPADPTVQPAAPQDPVAAMMAAFRDAGIALDLAQGTISIDAVVGRPNQALEYLLIDRRGKSHEAMFVCHAKASILNAAFIALGYAPGKNARVVERDPLPPPEDVAKGVPWFDVFPPEGQPVWITVKWKRVDENGDEVEVEVPVEDLLLDTTTDRPIEGAEWLYLGGQMAPIYRNEPPVFVGDYEGNLISNVYMPQPNHLVTVKHERADDDQIWWITSLLPEPDTSVTFVIHKTETPLHVARRERLAKEQAARDAAGGDAPAQGENAGGEGRGGESGGR
ncbi:MAG: hypothetical protein IPM29_21600 [Planctomycetes bacterium]|nr:hypothetical protein [Planctomycetota bacterium]